jgi:hypothetical protein
MKVGNSVGHKVRNVDAKINDSVFYPVHKEVTNLVWNLIIKTTWNNLNNLVRNPTNGIKRTIKKKL